MSALAHFLSTIDFPRFTGRRLMMLPFDVEDPDSLHPAQVGGYAPIVFALLAQVEHRPGVGYLTIDEGLVEAGTTQRRPGLHVDGCGAYGGGGGYAREGMILAASCDPPLLYDVEAAAPSAEGDCEHERGRLGTPLDMRAGEAWWCASHCVHESQPMSQPMSQTGPRQFLRISLPSDAAFHWPYTPNIMGVQPPTAPGPDRALFMRYRDGASA